MNILAAHTKTWGFFSLTPVDSPVLGLGGISQPEGRNSGWMSGLRRGSSVLCLKAGNDCLGSVLGCAVFNVSVSDLEEMAECLLLKFQMTEHGRGQSACCHTETPRILGQMGPPREVE